MSWCLSDVESFLNQPSNTFHVISNRDSRSFSIVTLYLRVHSYQRVMFITGNLLAFLLIVGTQADLITGSKLMNDVLSSRSVFWSNRSSTREKSQENDSASEECIQIQSDSLSDCIERANDKQPGFKKYINELNTHKNEVLCLGGVELMVCQLMHICKKCQPQVIRMHEEAAKDYLKEEFTNDCAKVKPPMDFDTLACSGDVQIWKTKLAEGDMPTGVPTSNTKPTANDESTGTLSSEDDMSLMIALILIGLVLVVLLGGSLLFYIFVFTKKDTSKTNINSLPPKSTLDCIKSYLELKSLGVKTKSGSTTSDINSSSSSIQSNDVKSTKTAPITT